jgi:DNA repair/transcription protein MET18/MMS19
VLKSLGKQFLSRYIALAEGEKDPRNLMVAFTVVRVLLIEFDISEHVEVSHASKSCLNDE